MEAIVKTDFNFPGQTAHYVGKVRDVYSIGNDYLVMVVSDRISAFDVVLPKGIPFKGQVLNQIAAKFLDATTDILPNWKIAVPDPMVTIGHKCEPFKVEMVIRGYLSGHAWREYKAGKRTICGVEMPEGMVENQKFPTPIITPTTKAAEGHDEDISKEEIIAQGIVSKEDYEKLEAYTQAIFQRGTEIAAKMGLILVDTKNDSLCLVKGHHLDNAVGAGFKTHLTSLTNRRVNTCDTVADADCFVRTSAHTVTKTDTAVDTFFRTTEKLFCHLTGFNTVVNHLCFGFFAEALTSNNSR